MKSFKQQLDENTSFNDLQKELICIEVKDFLEQFRENSIDQAQIDWNEGLDQIISSVQKENLGEDKKQ